MLVGHFGRGEKSLFDFAGMRKVGR